MGIHKKQIATLVACTLAVLSVGCLIQAAQASSPLTNPQRWIWAVDDPPGKQTTIVGQYPDGGFGQTLAMGDVNGDGYDDLMVGAPYVSTTAQATGEIYVFPGPLEFGQAITVPRHVALVLQGDGGYQPQLGSSIASGDLNGDGYDDIVTGDPWQKRASVYLGSPDITATLPLTVVATPDTMALNVLGADDGFGFAVCNINGDAYDDLFVQSQLRVWGILGHAGLSMTQPLTIAVTRDPVDLTVMGFPVGFWFGGIQENLGCGDVDGDGYNDLVVGVPGASPDGREDAGRVYVVRGSSQITYGHPITVEASSQADLIVNGIDGGNPGDLLGTSLDVADVNGDGRADLILGAPYADGPGNSVYMAGEVYLWLGRELHGQTVDLATDAEWVLYGDREPSQLGGVSVSSGDFDSDGRAEALLGCKGCAQMSRAPYLGGRAYVIDADQIQGTHCVTEAASLEIGSIGERIYVGDAVGPIDLDGNGYQDVLLTASGGYPHEHRPGTAWVVSYPLRQRLFFPIVWDSTR